MYFESDLISKKLETEMIRSYAKKIGVSMTIVRKSEQMRYEALLPYFRERAGRIKTNFGRTNFTSDVKN